MADGRDPSGSESGAPDPLFADPFADDPFADELAGVDASDWDADLLWGPPPSPADTSGDDFPM